MLSKAILNERLADLVVGLFLGLMLVLTACGGEREDHGLISGRAAERTPVVPASVVETGVPSPVAAKLTPRPAVTGPVSFGDAETAFREQRYGDAVDLFTVYTDDRPENAWGQYMLGLSAWKAGDPDRAERAFEYALALDPTHVKSLLNLSRVLLETDRPEQALEEINRVLDLDSVSVDGHRLLGRARHAVGDPEGAIEAYKRAIVLDDRDAWSMNNLGYVLITQSRFEEALLPLARATELQDGVAVFQNNLGIALERTGHLPAAAEAYRTALVVDPEYDKARTSLARVEAQVTETTDDTFDRVATAGRFVHEVESWRRSFGGEPAVTLPGGSEASDPDAHIPR